MVNINIQKKDLWLLSAIMVFLVGVVFVIAYNSGASPSVMGHSAEEIGFTPASYNGEKSVTFPNGVIFKYGTRSGSGSVSFDSDFPNAIKSVAVTPTYNAGYQTNCGVSSVSTSGFTVSSCPGTVYWIAIGY